MQIRLVLALNTRIAFPLNADLSISAGASFVNYVFQGRDGAAYFISPSISLIVTMNTEAPRSPYLVAGLGAYLPLAGDTEKDESGPIVEAGIGWVFGLQATSVSSGDNARTGCSTFGSGYADSCSCWHNSVV